MAAIIDTIAHITLADGRHVQVLNADGTDWDEAATAAEAARLQDEDPQ